MPAKKPPTIRALENTLKSYQRQFHAICEFAKILGESTTVSQVTVRLEKLEEMWEKVNEVITNIEMHDDFTDDTDTYTTQRSEFSIRYFEAKSAFLDKLREIEEPLLNSSIRALDTSQQSTIEHVRLPQIKLQTFDGNIDEWMSFRDLYSSLIHWKHDLPEVEKFHYLKGCLAGEAKALIDSLAITKANYQVAWDTLVKRYNDSKVLKRRQVHALFNIPSLQKESAPDLQSLVEGFARIIQSLDQLVNTPDYKDLLLVDIICSRLDPSTRRGWEEYSAEKEQDKVKDLMDFLQKRVKVLNSLPAKATEFKATSSQAVKGKSAISRTSHAAIKSSGGRCVACSEAHYLNQCPSFQRMSISARDKLVRNNSLCRNCLKRGHQASDCASRFVCRHCKGQHHSMVCFRPDKDKGKNSETKGSTEHNSKQSSNDTESSARTDGASTSGIVASNVASQRTSSVLLATAVVLVEDDEGGTYPARALLDSGSECNFMTERLCQRLKVKRSRSDVMVHGIGQANSQVKYKVEATIKSRTSEFTCGMEFLLLSKVTVNLPTSTIAINNWKIPDGIQLADPAFFKPNSVDLILGIQHFFEFFANGKIHLGDDLPSLTESVFGWIVCGTIDSQLKTPEISCSMATTVNLDELLSRFWSCEEIGSPKNYSPEERRCEEQFARSVSRGSDGRYTVPLPKNDDIIAQLGESRHIALKRLQGLENRLAKDPELCKQYHDFLDEYLELGHMRKVESNLQGAEEEFRCYLPHHPVVKQSSTTTRVRAVYNASSKTSTGITLNDALLVGPTIQEDLRSIIIRGRMKPIMIVSDVEKMFRQIWTLAADIRLQSILYRKHPEDEVETYELTTVTYGTKPAPYLATKALQQLSSDEQHRFPLAAKVINEDVYMDDVFTGADSEEEAVELRKQLDAMLESGGFHLRKWASNCPAVLQGIPAENLALVKNDEVELDPDPSIKTLGLVWRPGSDVLKFQFRIDPQDPSEVMTKRKVLSMIATLFDPLGIIGAVTTTAKVFMQRLWCLVDENGKKLDWDTPLPNPIMEEWKIFHGKLPYLNDITVPRCVVIPKAITTELHLFSDASLKAYGACAYIRSCDSDGNYRVALLTSKSKVAPLKTQSIPRLELCGALLAAQLAEKVLQSLKQDMKVFFWVDSTCVLRWLESTPSTWTTFVANRVAGIQNLTEGRPWNHVPGKENPADLISRGVMPEDLQDNSLWWEGPQWLKQDEQNWPNQLQLPEDIESQLEKRRTTAACVASESEDFGRWYVSKFSSYTDLVRRTAYWLRLMDMLKTKQRLNGALTTEELRNAEFAVLRKVQQESFQDEWKRLSKGEAVARSSPLRWFNPRLSRDNLIRVGGRLGHSSEPEDTKHPIVLPSRHPVTKMILEHYHFRLLHAGPQLLLSTVRLKYWPLGGRNLARNVVHHCQRCFRMKPPKVQQFMGDLPGSRVTPARPFSKTGVDYFGPIYVRPGPRRVAVKAYVAVFVCMCTKAVHLELVSDLSTNRFIQALRRFISRRGKCTDIYSDNGTNFVGARNQMDELMKLLKSKDHKEKVTRECTNDGIQWHFIPPAAPHFGGLWEAAVKSAKQHLLKVLGDNPVSIEDMNTLLCQVEACLNSRPLTALSDDPNDLTPLTPGHFLVGAPLHQLPDLDYLDTPSNRVNQCQLMQKRLQEFWKRWRTEYLTQLQARTKRWRPPIKVEEGSLVIVRDDNVPPYHWKMGRILEVHPGSDGVVRVVTIKTASSTFKRPVEKICLLPTNESREFLDQPPDV